MNEAQLKAQIDSMREAVKDTESKIASGEVPTAAGGSADFPLQTQSFESLLLKQKIALLELELEQLSGPRNG